MGRPSLTHEDYVRAATEKDLILQTDIVAENIKYTTDRNIKWMCIHCGRIHQKAYRSVKVANYGCVCQYPRSRKIGDYHDVEELYGIKMAELQFNPYNTKEQIKWIGRNGNEVWASYWQLVHQPNLEILAQLGVYLT